MQKSVALGGWMGAWMAGLGIAYSNQKLNKIVAQTCNACTAAFRMAMRPFPRQGTRPVDNDVSIFFKKICIYLQLLLDY